MENSKNKNIAIIDYKLSNLNSVKNCIKKMNFNFSIINSEKNFIEASHYILPGVGSFKKAMDNLKEMKIIPLLKTAIEKKKKLLGICLGMQLLFEKSFEGGESEGLGLVKGEVKKLIKFQNLNVPNIGWASINVLKKDRFINEINSKSFFYFVHSYACYATDKKISLATLKYKEDFDIIIRDKNIYGVQFHPEKSQDEGLKILKNFLHD